MSVRLFNLLKMLILYRPHPTSTLQFLKVLFSVRLQKQKTADSTADGFYLPQLFQLLNLDDQLVGV